MDEENKLQKKIPLLIGKIYENQMEAATYIKDIHDIIDRVAFREKKDISPDEVVQGVKPSVPANITEALDWALNRSNDVIKEVCELKRRLNSLF